MPEKKEMPAMKEKYFNQFRKAGNSDEKSKELAAEKIKKFMADACKIKDGFKKGKPFKMNDESMECEMSTESEGEMKEDNLMQGVNNFVAKRVRAGQPKEETAAFVDEAERKSAWARLKDAYIAGRTKGK